MKHLAKILSLGAAIAVAPLAHASTISIGLQETGATCTGTLAGSVCTVGTDSATPGQAFFFGSYGTFNINQITALGYPAISSGSLVTGSVQASSSVAGTLTIYITEQGLTSPVGPSSALSSFTSNIFSGSALSVVESTLFSQTNQLYAGNTMASASFTGLGTSASTIAGNITGTYSETVKYVVTVGAGTSNVNDTIDITPIAATPEPSSLIMLGTGLMSAAGMMVRRRKIS